MGSTDLFWDYYTDTLVSDEVEDFVHTSRIVFMTVLFLIYLGVTGKNKAGGW